jgi:hypothetical protein
MMLMNVFAVEQANNLQFFIYYNFIAKKFYKGVLLMMASLVLRQYGRGEFDTDTPFRVFTLEPCPRLRSFDELL